MSTHPLSGASLVSDAEVPDNLIPVLVEFTRLADEATALIANGRLFPGLSTLAGITPVVGFLTDFCASRVIPDIRTGSLPVDSQAMIGSEPVGPHGVYL